MPNTCYSPWRKPWRRTWGLASGISKPAACRSFQCQNGPPEDRCNDGWLALSGWPQAQKVGPGGEAPYQLLYRLLGLVASIFKLWNWSLAVPAAGALCYPCWPNKGLYQLARFGASSKTSEAIGECEFRRWGPDVGAIGCPKQINLIEWYLLVWTASNEEFECFQLKAFSLYPCFSEEKETVYLHPYSHCHGDNQSENNT